MEDTNVTTFTVNLENLNKHDVCIANTLEEFSNCNKKRVE